MSNEQISTQKKIGGMVLDIITIGMLFAAFGAIFYSGFILQSESFPLGWICAITAIGLLLLFFIGTVSCMATKVKNNALTVGFLVFSALQVCALIVNLALLLALMTKIFTVDLLPVRLTYAVTTALVLVGYVASVMAYSDGIVDEDASEEDEATADEDEEPSEEDEEPADEVLSEEDEEAKEEADSDELTEADDAEAEEVGKSDDDEVLTTDE